MTGALLDQIRPLPRRVKPVNNETLQSYLRRLALANRLDPLSLRDYLTGDRRQQAPIHTQPLSVMTGCSVHALKHAMPELCHPHELAALNLTGRPRPSRDTRPQHACEPCCFGKGIDEPVTVWRRHDDLVCHRHRRWIGPGDQMDLSPFPSILNANKFHHYLIRRHGRETVRVAFAEAQQVIWNWHMDNHHKDAFIQLIKTFPNSRPRQTDCYNTLSYPQVIALTRLLASPRWMNLIIKDNPQPEPINTSEHLEDFKPNVLADGGPGTQRFVAEVNRTVATEYRWNPHPHYGVFEPLVTHLLQEVQHHYNPARPQLISYPEPETCPLDQSASD